MKIILGLLSIIVATEGLNVPIPKPEEHLDLSPVPFPEANLHQDEPQAHAEYRYGGEYGGYGGGRGGGQMCNDKKGVAYCGWVVSSNKCEKRKSKKNCRKSCGLCQEECEDTSFNCELADAFRCSNYLFAYGCRKSCKLCVEVATTIQPEEECNDAAYNCDSADKYRCRVFWFKLGCRKSCGVCQVKTTTPTAPPLTTPARTTRPKKTTPEPATTSYVAPTTTESSAEETTPEPEPTEPQPTPICVDEDQKNCHTWESLGLCYNPRFKDDMEELCPLSCQLCS